MQEASLFFNKYVTVTSYKVIRKGFASTFLEGRIYRRPCTFDLPKVADSITMATSADLESWKALGGTVKEDKKRKRYIAPSGGLL